MVMQINQASKLVQWGNVPRRIQSVHRVLSKGSNMFYENFEYNQDKK